MKWPAGAGSVAGWAGIAFLIGIALHSAWPHEAVSAFLISTFFALGAGMLAMCWKSTAARTAAFCVLALLCGVWRFELVRPTLPRGLAPFTPKGLAYATDAARVSDRDDPRYWLGRAKRTLTDRAFELFPPDEAGLLVGVLYGERRLSPNLRNDFRDAGLLHLVAVSGTNVTFVVVIIMRSLLALRLPRRSAFVALTLALVALVLFVNPAASVVRAAIMGWLIEFAPIVGRLPRASRLLLIAAVAFTAWKPWALFFDAGFALSFLAMWALLAWSPVIDEGFKRWIPYDGARSIFAATLAATLLTTPYSIWAFGRASIWGLATNLLALPLVSWIMVIGLLALAAPFIPFFAWSAHGFLAFLIYVGRLPRLLPGVAWSRLELSFVGMLGIYAALLLIWRKLERRNRASSFAHVPYPQHVSET